MNKQRSFKCRGGSYCAVSGCSNSYYNLKIWKNTTCTEHPAFLHSDCPCLLPYSLHSFPKNVENRNKWIAALNRKDYKPTSSSVVCSLHFIDGRPTTLNPNPEINLGYEKKVVYGRRKMVEIENKKSKKSNKVIKMEKEEDDVFPEQSVMSKRGQKVKNSPVPHVTSYGKVKESRDCGVQCFIKSEVKTESTQTEDT